MSKTLVHPFDESTKHTYPQLCEKVRNFYGIEDAEAWYSTRRREILDKCKPDRFNMAQFATLREFWETRQMESRWTGLDSARIGNNAAPISDGVAIKHNGVELYKVRGPGANGEIGVLTTTHDVNEFIAGLASASASYLKDSSDLEASLSWILRNALPIAFKLAGYKADQVVERHVLMCGSSAPASDDIVASS